MISRLRWVALGAAALLLSACASIEVGKDFDLKAFESHAQRGVTTQDQVRGWLGAPKSPWSRTLNATETRNSANSWTWPII